MYVARSTEGILSVNKRLRRDLRKEIGGSFFGVSLGETSAETDQTLMRRNLTRMVVAARGAR